MSNHAWCRDPSRDERVRAAEDGRDRPLPTLEEAIARPFAHAAERSSTVSKTGEGQSGMRTERVTLEVTHDSHLSLRDWPSLRTFFGESVRVVEETESSDVAELEAASGGGEGEPVAWGVRMKSGTFKGFLFPSREQANKCAELISDEVVAFFEEPPQPRGWLTEDQKDAIRTAREHLSVGLIGTEENSGWYKVHKRRVDALNDLLARSTPPEVRLPLADLGDRLLRDSVIHALAEAGVAVKEVGE